MQPLPTATPRVSSAIRHLDDRRMAGPRGWRASTRASMGPLRTALAWSGTAADVAIMQVMERLFLSEGRPNTRDDVRERMERGLRTYAEPSLFEDGERYFRRHSALPPIHRVSSGSVPRGERTELRWHSEWVPFDAEYAARYRSFLRNETVHVRYLRHRDPRRPTLIYVHGWCGGHLGVEEAVSPVPFLYRSGFNVALFTMPFHGERTPIQARFGGQYFPNRDLQRTNEAFGQAICDLRVLIEFLREDNSDRPVGLLGISLGGYTSALLCGLGTDADFVIPVIAPASFADLLWDHGQNHPARREVESIGFNLDHFRELWSIHCPLAWPLRLPRDRALLIAGHGDVIVPEAHAEAYWEHWGHPEIHWFHGGHLMHFGRDGYYAVLRRFFRGHDLLNARGVREGS